MPATITDPTTGERFNLYSRGEVGLRPPRAVRPLLDTSEGAFHHHSVTPMFDTFSIWRGVQAYHMDANGWNDIAYSFGVTEDGHLLEGRGLFVAGGHTRGFNLRSHAICYVGNAQEHRPSNKALRASRAGFKWLEAITRNGMVRPHRQVSQTACPGSFNVDWLNAGMPPVGAPPVDQPAPPAGDPSVTLPVPHFRFYDFNGGQVLRPGSRGAAVSEVQWFHNLLWIGAPAMYVAIDGVYGPETEMAIIDDQSLWNLLAQPHQRIAVDGVFGPTTAVVYTFMLDAAVERGRIDRRYWS